MWNVVFVKRKKKAIKPIHPSVNHLILSYVYNFFPLSLSPIRCFSTHFILSFASRPYCYSYILSFLLLHLYLFSYFSFFVSISVPFSSCQHLTKLPSQPYPSFSLSLAFVLLPHPYFSPSPCSVHPKLHLTHVSSSSLPSSSSPRFPSASPAKPFPPRRLADGGKADGGVAWRGVETWTQAHILIPRERRSLYMHT